MGRCAVTVSAGATWLRDCPERGVGNGVLDGLTGEVIGLVTEASPGVVGIAVAVVDAVLEGLAGGTVVSANAGVTPKPITAVQVTAMVASTEVSLADFIYSPYLEDWSFTGFRLATRGLRGLAAMTIVQDYATCQCF